MLFVVDQVAVYAAHSPEKPAFVQVVDQRHACLTAEIEGVAVFAGDVDEAFAQPYDGRY